MSNAIFISYRRKESLAEARAVFERLRSQFPTDGVFIDLEGLDYGVDFVEALQEQLERCRVMLALIGPSWAGVVSSQERRIDDVNDFVRIELRMALERRIRVVPVLVNGAHMPTTADLPEDLQPLVRRQALELDFRRFDADMGRLCAALRRLLDAPLTSGQAKPDLERGSGAPTHGTEVVDARAHEPESQLLATAAVSSPLSTHWRRHRVLWALGGLATAGLGAGGYLLGRPVTSRQVAGVHPTPPPIAAGPPPGQPVALPPVSTSPPVPAPTPLQAPPPPLPHTAPPSGTTLSPIEALLVRIAHVGPTSGAIGHLGQDNERGARLAIAELNARKLSIGGRKATFELLAEDDAADPRQGIAIAQKLVEAKVHGVVGHLNSGTSIPASRIYSDAGIPQISPSATNPKFTRQGYKTTFRVIADDVHLGATVGRFTVNQLKGKSIAVIDDRTAYGMGVAEEFEKGVKAAGGKTIPRVFTTDKATDFTAILTSLKGKMPDVVFFGGMDAVAGPMLRQMKQLGIQAKFVGGDGICSSELPKLAQDGMADNQVVCAEAGGVEGETKSAMEAFERKFRARFNADVQFYAPYVYDAVNVMVAAMVAAKSADPKVYLPVLARTAGYKGVTGTISFDSKGDIKNGALTLYTYRGGKRDQVAVVR